MKQTEITLTTFVSVLCPYRNPAFSRKGPEPRDEYQIELSFEPPDQDEPAEAMPLGRFVEEVQHFYDTQISGEKLAAELAEWAASELERAVVVEVQTRDAYPPPLRVRAVRAPEISVD